MGVLSTLALGCAAVLVEDCELAASGLSAAGCETGWAAAARGVVFVEAGVTGCAEGAGGRGWTGCVSPGAVALGAVGLVEEDRAVPAGPG